MQLRRFTLAACALLLLTGAPAAASQPGAKVTQSTNANPADYPAQVALLQPGEPDTFFAQYCGGTLILSDWVLTAAHCIVDAGIPSPEVLVGTATLGDSSGQRVTVSQVVVHPGYSTSTLVNDIALLHLSTPVAVTPARLVYPGQQLFEVEGADATVTGWGGLSGDESNQTFPTSLQVGHAPIISDETCAAVLAEYGPGSGPDDGATQVCAGAGTSTSQNQADACRGDSGGPLWLEVPTGRRQAGIVSYGPTCGYSPTVYSDVTAFMPFIEQTTGQQLASFPDIPLNIHEANIELVTIAGIAGGLPDGTYHPDDPVTRGQMATFLARALGLAPVATGPFSDVAGDTHEGNINAVAAAGIAGGFPDGTYRPGDPVTRAQMATFIVRARQLPPVASGPFTDVAGDTHEQDINAVAAAGIAGGFPDGTYRPTTNVTRGQMATFMARGFLAD